MNPDDPLLKILACPLDKGPLLLLVADEPVAPKTSELSAELSSKLSAEALYNPRLHRRYPIVDGIPQLLPSSGEQVTEDEHEELLKRLAP
jgi:uncharacterized protein YbaR (Trm112 family)